MASEKKTDKNKKQMHSLHPMLILVIIVVFCALLSYVFPAGVYERVYDEEIGREIVDPGSFTYVERTPASFMDLMMSLTLGMQRAADIIFFLLIIGGMFEMMNGTGALNVGIANMLQALRGKEFLLIPLLVAFFGCGAAFCGNFEEFLVFVPLIMACCITAGYDSLMAVGIIFMSAAAGYGGGITNAFTVRTAQQICGLPMFSGMPLRIVLFVVLELTVIVYLIIYSFLVKKNPEYSGAYNYDMKYNQDKKIDLEHIPELTVRQAFVILIFIVAMVFAVWGVITQGYYIDELSAVFLTCGIATGIVGGLRPGQLCSKFIAGCKNMMLPAVMIGLANSVIIILQNTGIMDSLLHFMTEFLNGLPDILSALGMFVFHLLFNVMVPSGSAQAAITMPLMVPLADSANITRQTAVLAYQMGDAFTNILAPTGGEILAALAICRVPFGKWIRFLLPVFILWCAEAMIILVYAVRTAYV